MNFSCDRCGRLYSIADEKVQGRSFRVKCKACEHTIVVRAAATAPAAGQAPHGPALTPAPFLTPVPMPSAAPASVRPPSAGPPPVPRAVPAAPPPPPGDDGSFADRGDAGGTATTPVVRAPEPPPVARAQAREPALSGAELDWLAGASAAAAPPADDAAPPSDRATAPAPRRRRLLVAAAAFAGVAACVAAALLLGPGRRKVPRPAPGPVAAAPAPAPVPAAPPAPPPAEAAPTPAVAATATDAAPPPPSPAATRARAGFQPVALDAGGRDRPRSLQIANKDRKLLDLLDRKQDAAPAAAIAKTSLDTGRSALDRDSVEQALADNRAAFGACVTKAVKANPRLRLDDRKATLMLTVQPTGVVSSCWIAEADLEKTSLGRCLVAASRRVVFPAFQGEAIDVSAPLALSAVR